MPRFEGKSEFRAVLLDVDGTLVDTIEMIVAGLGDAFEAYLGHRPEDSALKSLIGMPLSVQMNLFGMDALTTSSLEERVRFTMDRYIAHGGKIKSLAGAVRAYEILLDRGVPTALVTSRNREELEWILTLFPLFAATEVTVTASDVQRPKPDAEPALLACRLLGVAPSEACFVGDSIHDVECAQAADVAAIAVASGASTFQELEAHKPDVLLANDTDLLDWVQQTIFTSSTCFLTTRNESNNLPRPQAASLPR